LPIIIDRESANLDGQFSTKLPFQVYQFSSWQSQPLGFNKDLNVWLDKARLHPRYISKQTQIKNAELYNKDILFGDKTIQQWKWNSMYLTPVQENKCLKLPPMSN
jgi:hypothetical protein